jgi:hypothetical protein
MGTRRCQTLRVVSMDIRPPYARLVGQHAVNAQLVPARASYRRKARVELRLENPEPRISLGNLLRDDSRAGQRLKL